MIIRQEESFGGNIKMGKDRRPKIEAVSASMQKSETPKGNGK